MTETHTEAPSSYAPSTEFVAQANAGDDLYRKAEQDRLTFWAEQANRLSWATPFSQVLDWSAAPFAKWFTDGKLNVTYNCVDRHVEAGNGGRVAIHWEGERVGEDRTLTYSDLLTEVSKAANALAGLGLVAGDRVAIYMPMIPEAIVAMLACARLGVLHSVVFAGFTATALGARIADAQAKLLITADGQFRHGKPEPLKEAADQAVADASTSRTRPGGPAHRHRRALDAGTRRVVARRRRLGVTGAHSRGVRRRASAVPAVHLGHHRQAQGHRAHQRRLSHPGVLHPLQRLRHQAGNRRVLVHRRHRLGHRTHLRRLRPAVQRRNPGYLRGNPKHAQPAPAFPDHRKVRRDNLLHGPDDDPHLYEVGPRNPGRPRLVQPAAAGDGR